MSRLNDLREFKEGLVKLEKQVEALQALAPDRHIRYELGGVLDAIENVEGPVDKEIEQLEDEEAESEESRYGSYRTQHSMRVSDFI